MQDEELDLLEEIEQRAVFYYTSESVLPDVVVVSSDLASILVKEIYTAMIRPSFGITPSSPMLFKEFTFNTSVGQLTLSKTDKYGDNFIFVGRKDDLGEGEGLNVLERAIADDTSSKED